VHSNFNFSKNSLKNMEGVDDRLVKLAHLALKYTRVDFGIPSTGGLRDELMQHKIFLDGKSQCDGRHKKSKHQFGKALDFFAYVGELTYERHYMLEVAIAFLKASRELDIKIDWGGFWNNFEDLPHIELIEE
jgi:hypothetical protein